MRRYARPKIERDAVEVVALSRRTVGPALLETGGMRITVVPTPRTLREITPECGQMSDLRRRKTTSGRSDSGIGLGNTGVRGDPVDRSRRPDPGSPSLAPEDPGHFGGRNDINDWPSRDPAAAALREISAGRAEFGR